MVSFYFWLAINALLIKCEVDRILGLQKQQEQKTLIPFPKSDLISVKVLSNQGFQLHPQWPGSDWEKHFCEAFVSGLTAIPYVVLNHDVSDGYPPCDLRF